MKNCFHFILKVIFFFKIFKFCLDLLGDVDKRRLDKKAEINFKSYDFTTWLRNNYNTWLPNISRNKGNMAMKFSQLLEYNMRNIFLENPYKNCGREASPTPLYEKYFWRKLHDFKENYFLRYILLTNQIFLPGCFWGINVITIYYQAVVLLDQKVKNLKI